MAMAAGQPRTTSAINAEVARLVRQGSPDKHFVTMLNEADPVDLIVTLPDLTGCLFLKIQTTSRQSKGQFGEWLVVDFTAPRDLAPDPRLSYVFGCYSPTALAFTGPVFVVPSTLIQASPHPTSAAMSSRISFKARVDAVNQEWSQYAVAPEQLGDHMLALLKGTIEAQRQVA